MGATVLPASLDLLPSSLPGCWQAVGPVGGQRDTYRHHGLSTADSPQFYSYTQAHIESHISANKAESHSMTKSWSFATQSGQQHPTTSALFYLFVRNHQTQPTPQRRGLHRVWRVGGRDYLWASQNTASHRSHEHHLFISIMSYTSRCPVKDDHVDITPLLPYLSCCLGSTPRRWSNYSDIRHKKIKCPSHTRLHTHTFSATGKP